MKKVIISFMFLFVLTGCSNSVVDSVTSIGTKEMVCTMLDDDVSDDSSTTNTMTVNYKGDLITKIKSVSVTESDPTYFKDSIDMMNTVMTEYKKIKGITFTISSKDRLLTMLMEIDFNKLDIDALIALSNEYEEDGETATTNIDYLVDKKPSLKLFKEQELEGYTCK